MKWLVTCFEPFENAKTNSSEILWRQIQKAKLDNVRFAGPLPVTFSGAWKALKEEIANVDGVLALGQAEGRKKITLECIALNWVDARIPDNEGAQPKLVPVMSQSPDVLWSQIPWTALGENEQWERSYYAGTFVCNHLMYEIVHWARESGKLGGFVHIPVLTSQKDAQFKDSPKMEEAEGKQALEAILKYLADLK